MKQIGGFFTYEPLPEVENHFLESLCPPEGDLDVYKRQMLSRPIPTGMLLQIMSFLKIRAMRSWSNARITSTAMLTVASTSSAAQKL